MLVISDNSIELTKSIYGLETRLKRAIVSKMRTVVEQIYQKVHGALPSFKIDHGVETQGNLVIGWFEPAEPKAIAREFGGKGWYEINPSKARLLKFLGTRDGKMVYTDFVWHPPSKEFRDIRNAIEEKMPEIFSGLDW